MIDGRSGRVGAKRRGVEPQMTQMNADKRR
jgi:hypothetical protein